MPGLFLIEEEYRVALLDTESAFTARLIERMNNPGTEWMDPWAAFHGEDPPAQEKNTVNPGQDHEYQ